MLPLQIAMRNATLTPEMEADIRERAERLALYYDRIMGCRVAVQLPHRRRHEGMRYYVRIDLTVPGGELVIRRRPHEELRTAVQIAFNAARRRLQDYARRRRGTVKTHEPHPIARVSQYYPLGGYGFLETADGQAVYFDRNSVLDGGFDRLDVGSQVRFTEEEGEKGPQASSVVPLGTERVEEEV
ncbi:MAG TPA: HPF/RaiA family ribosome-associated protein [Gemmatimonadales bacterium]|nr:HPF/RaiA family ribosome-associated protein [Gemmatimonadales bacterium]